MLCSSVCYRSAIADAAADADAREAASALYLSLLLLFSCT